MNTTPKADPKRLLWVDEEYSSLPWLCDQLRSLVPAENFVTARTSQDAREVLSQHDRIACVLLDIMLPRNVQELFDEQVRLDEGISLLEDLKKGVFPAAPSRTPIVIFTARGNNEKLRRMQDLLSKDTDILLRKAINSPDEVINEIRMRLGVGPDAAKG